MIVSHKHRFIFIKTRKTAGTSIEIALSKFCGETDIITRISPTDEATRASLGYRGPQNDLLAFRHYTANDWLRFLTRGRRARLRNHMSAARIRAVVGETIWQSYFKFCVERDPWDKAISLYYWRTREADPRPGLLNFLSTVDTHSLSNFEIYCIDGALATDRVVRFERLSAELEDVRHLLDLPEPLALPQAKGGHRSVKQHYSQLLGAAEKTLIDTACAREIELFDYGFRRLDLPDKQ
ncbi:MAG: sulfotransferase family 2 domain-containing protein [Gammaproteobacteria bacterium]|nr:sulfotransferase family 2 domain-containing protein [Gammaproteobacteria bacterium]